MKKITLLLVDDHLVVRMGLTSVLRFEKDMQVVGEAEDGKQAIELYRKYRPDVVIMDLRMPIMDGAEATAAIKESYPGAHILILTTFEDTEDIQRALTAGAKGALLKNSGQSELVKAIRIIHAGGQFISKDVEQQMTSNPPLPDFTERQLEILHSVTRGLTNQDIATQLGISPSGVKAHLSAIFAKLGAADRAEAAAIAISKHLLRKKE
jgi:two-component system, NarL family, response regulator